MKRWAALALVAAIAGGGLWLAEHRQADALVSPRALLYFIADNQRELTRLPMGLTRLSDEEEIRIGKELTSRYEPAWQRGEPDPERDAIQDYVNRVGQRVAVRAHRKLPYSFHYIPDSGFVNAFALPGGPVFIGAGMLAVMDSEDELASVLAHEVEHIDHRHCAERVQLEAGTQGLGIFRVILELPLTVFEAGYSKDQELQADAEGARLMVLAGYSPMGAVRMFETFDRLYQEHVAKARTPQEELTQVAEETLSGYFRSHPAASERAEQVRRLIESEQWKITPERDLEVGYVLWTKRAEAALDAHQYERAQGLAEQALKARPGHMKALWVLAQAQARQGEFAAAANAIRQMLDVEPHNVKLIGEYARLLAGVPNHERALQDFLAWAQTAQADQRVVTVPIAGLALLARRPQLAEKAVAEARANANLAGEWLADLGWWCYRAQQYEMASGLLREAQQRRPGDLDIAHHLGWTDVEQGLFADALHDFGYVVDVSAGPTSISEDMGRAVALWLGQQREPALAEFGRVYDTWPEWKNPRWVRALYTGTVWRAVSQMAAERDRQRRAAVHPAS